MSTITSTGPDARAEDLLVCLDELPPDQRAVVVERHYVRPDGSWDQIATAVGLPESDAARRLYTQARIGLIRCWRRRRQSDG